VPDAPIWSADGLSMRRCERCEGWRWSRGIAAGDCPQLQWPLPRELESNRFSMNTSGTPFECRCCRASNTVSAMTLRHAAETVRQALAEASTGLVEREVVVELIALAAIAQEHLLVIGPPGTAKSEAVRRVARVLGGSTFEYLLGRFTEPSEVFGPVDLRKLREGLVETQTAGMLPEADFVFLDEVFLGSTAILNTLLGVLNERTFRRGHTSIRCPLRVCVGASNALPEEPALAAFSDRFLVRVFVEPTSDTQLENLLAGGAALAKRTLGAVASLQDVQALTDAASHADMSAVREPLAQAIRLLRGGGIVLSDRRVVKAQRLIAAAAVVSGREHPNQADLWPLVYAVPTVDQQRLARDLLRDVLANSQSETLLAATEAATDAGPARAARLAAVATALLDAPPHDEAQRSRWKLKLEGVAREVDASFDVSALPEVLAPVRERLVAMLTPPQ
jgi:MoxR-like ATPase